MAKILAFYLLLGLAFLAPATAFAYVKSAQTSVSVHLENSSRTDQQSVKKIWLERLALRKAEKKLKRNSPPAGEGRRMEGFSVASAVLALLGLLLLFSEIGGIGAGLILLAGLLGLAGLIRIGSQKGRFRRGSIALAILGLILGGLLLAVVISFGSQK